MTRLVPGGLRGRLLLALVLTSVVTLGAAAAVLLGSDLQSRLREQSAENLTQTALASRPQIQGALERYGHDKFALYLEADRLRDRTDGRVLIATLPFEQGKTSLFSYDTGGAGSRRGAVVALRAYNEQRTVVEIDGDDVRVAFRLFGPRNQEVGLLVAQRRLTEVAGTVRQVRRALLTAGLVGLAVALALAAALSGTLLRRLARLRTAAQRITHEGPDAPPTPRDDIRDEIGDLARALSRMQEQLRRQESARRSFVATASHELRTPLTLLQGTMELLEEDLRDGRLDLSDAQLQVATARRELRRLSTLASELLDLSRLDAAVQLRSELVELGELARAVAAEFALRGREREVEIDVAPPPEEGCWTHGDPDAVARVVRILLDNALRYAPAGEPVHLAAHCAEGRALIEVADHGPGIAEDEAERIFERFHRGRAAGSESGFGLGLAIGRELAERMGGTLDLRRREEPGARFVLSLPAARAADVTARS
jgi:signal transduction histidine kinase